MGSSLDNFTKKVEPIEDKNKFCRQLCAAPWSCDSCPIFPEGKRYSDYKKVINRISDEFEDDFMPVYDIPCDKCGKMIRTTNIDTELCSKCKPKKFKFPIVCD